MLQQTRKFSFCVELFASIDALKSLLVVAVRCNHLVCSKYNLLPEYREVTRLSRRIRVRAL